MKVSKPLVTLLHGSPVYPPDHDKGDWLTLKDIQKLVDEDTSMKNLSKIQEKEYINVLEAHWETMKTGVRALNKAAAFDCCGAVGRVSVEVHSVMSSDGCAALTLSVIEEPIQAHRCVCIGILHLH